MDCSPPPRSSMSAVILFWDFPRKFFYYNTWSIIEDFSAFNPFPLYKLRAGWANVCEPFSTETYRPFNVLLVKVFPSVKLDVKKKEDSTAANIRHSAIVVPFHHARYKVPYSSPKRSLTSLC